MQAESVVVGGGCFWGVEELFRNLPGVLETDVGYCGGISANPTYKEVSTGQTGHAEAVKITFNPEQITLDRLFDFFFRIHDPTTENRQGNDVGTQYRSVIFVSDESQQRAAAAAKARAQESGRWKKPVVTEIVTAKPFYKAEEYHQDYLVKYPEGYTCHYIRD